MILDYKLTFLVSLYLPKHTGSETGSRDIDLKGSAIFGNWTCQQCIIGVGSNNKQANNIQGRHDTLLVYIAEEWQVR